MIIVIALLATVLAVATIFINIEVTYESTWKRILSFVPVVGLAAWIGYACSFSRTVLKENICPVVSVTAIDGRVIQVAVTENCKIININAEFKQFVPPGTMLKQIKYNQWYGGIQFIIDNHYELVFPKNNLSDKIQIKEQI